MKTEKIRGREVRVQVRGPYSKEDAYGLAYMALQRFGGELNDCGAWVDYKNGVAVYHCDHGFEKILIKEIKHLNGKGAKMSYRFA